MNLVEKLLKADIKKAGELEKGIFPSRKLAKILGEKEAVEVEISEVNSRRANDIVSYQFDSKGKFCYEKTYDAKLMMCIEGVVSPDLRDKKLQEHFSCTNAKELCEKLFGFEVNALSDAISALSGIDGNEKEQEAEIKN